MCFLSPFQILPSHVVELIVDHVAGSSRLRLDNVTKGSKGYTELLVPLLSVCRDFRAVVLERYCKVHTLDLSCFSEQVHDKKALWPERLRRIDFPTHLHARELEITLGVFSVYNGTALKELLRAPHGGLLFPMVRTLKVTLTQTTREQRLLARIPTALDIESNIRAFVQRIRLVAPMTRRVCISLRSRSSNESQFATQPFGSLVEQLGQLGNTIEHRYSCRPLPLEPPPTGISSLTLEYSSNENRSNLVMRLARHNSATLRALIIYVGASERIYPLVLNDDGSCVEYPHLQELRIAKQIEWTLEEEPQSLPPVYPGAIPFPKLRRLSLKSEYPFGDDTPFRGNASTLEYLYLDLGYDIIRILRECQVFTRESHPKLQHVCSMAGFISIQSIFDSDASYMAFITSIGPLARVREMDYLLFSESFHSVIPVLGQYTCLQVLEVKWSFRSIREVITLIRALPLLSDLRIGSVTFGAQISRSYKHRLPAHMVASYAPISKRFRCWRFASCFSHDVKMLAYCVLLLALVCPSFDYAAVPARDRELFMAHMKRMVATDGFRPYKERLRRLLFGGWKNDIPSVKNIETWG